VDAVVIGVSKDSAASHDKFARKYELNFTLASDEKTDVAERYGMWVEKSMYGKKYMGMERSSVLIDGEGVIRAVWRKVKPETHAAEVLAAVKAL
jgi:peroxiredoxin Q/BCP